MSSINVNLADVDALLTRLDNVPGVLVQSLDVIMSDGVERMAREAIRMAPSDQGTLRQTIGTEKLEVLSYRYFANAEYSPFVEFGTRAQVDIPPGLEEYAAQFMGPYTAGALDAKTAIFQWCQRQGIDEKAWYAIYITLMTRGGKPHPFFFPAYEMIRPIMISEMTKVLVEDAFK